MPHTNMAVRAAGAWLAIASSLLIAALVVHGPLDPDLSDQMQKVADEATAWSAIHWVSAASLSLYAVAVIAGSEAQSAEQVVPAWSAWTAMVSGVASFAGWALGRWFGVDFGNLLWVASSVLLGAWILWFGIALMRSRASAT